MLPIPDSSSARSMHPVLSRHCGGRCKFAAANRRRPKLPQLNSVRQGANNPAPASPEWGTIHLPFLLERPEKSLLFCCFVFVYDSAFHHKRDVLQDTHIGER